MSRLVLALLLASVVLVPLALPGCAAIREAAALRQVDFTLDRVRDVRLADVRIDQVRRYEDLGPAQLGRIGLAFAEGVVPLSLTVEVGAHNPEDNVRARLLALDWTLLLADRETVSGSIQEELAIEPGEQVTIPVAAALDLVEFFDGGVRGLVEVALAVADPDGEPARVQLRLDPTISTPLGAIRYPEPITVGVGMDG